MTLSQYFEQKGIESGIQCLGDLLYISQHPAK